MELSMSEDEIVSRRELFTGWARGLVEGLAELVVPELEREGERLREALGAIDVDIAAGLETAHPWRELLDPRSEEPHGDGPPS